MGDPSIIYGVNREGLRFAVKDALHPVGHHGQDYHLPDGGGSEVVAYEECVVVECGIEVTRGFTSMLGWYLVARAKSDGRLIGWAHLRRGTRAALGKTLMPGDRVGLAASGPVPKIALGPTEAGIDYPGTAWAGAHIHTTDSDTIPGIFAGNTIDPLPRIHRALARLSAAGTGGYTPIDTSGGFLMALSDAEQRELLDLMRAQNKLALDVHGAIGAGQGAGLPANASVLANVRAANANTVTLAQSIASLPVDTSHAVWAAIIERYAEDGVTVVPGDVLNDLAKTGTLVRALAATVVAPLDPELLANTIAAKLPASAATSAADIKKALLDPEVTAAYAKAAAAATIAEIAS